MGKEIKKEENVLKEQKLPQEIYCEEDEIDLYELWLTIKKRKKVVFGLFFFSVIAAAVISLIKTPIYRSTATVIPISSGKSPLGGLSGLAAMAGISVGEEGSAKIMAVLNSRTIKEYVVKDLDLIHKFFEEMPKKNPLNKATSMLKGMVNISDDKKTGVISISIDYKDPELAKKIAEKYVEELQKILNEKSLTISKMNRVFLEKQLKEEESKLKKYQQEMAEFQKKNKIIEPNRQVAGTMGLYTRLVSQKVSLEVQLKRMETALSPDNPQVEILKSQIKEIDKQLRKIEQKTEGALPSLANAPEKIIKYTNLLRKLKASEAIYETLLKMYEQTKLEEAKENLFVEIIDYPILPDKPVKPKKKLMVAVAGVSSLFLGIFIAFFLEWLENIKKRRKLELE